MKIFYIHHALRDIGNPPTQEDGLKELGIKDANIVADIFEDGKKYITPAPLFDNGRMLGLYNGEMLNGSAMARLDYPVNAIFKRQDGHGEFLTESVAYSIIEEMQSDEELEQLYKNFLKIDIKKSQVSLT